MRRVPWVALAALATALGLRAAAALAPLAGLLPACPFKRLTGVACATCGITRCLLALGGGRWAEALHWHPVAATGLLLLPAAALWDLRRAWRDDPYPDLPASRAARIAAWAAFAGVWALQVARGI
jgi:hypothetical protein